MSSPINGWAEREGDVVTVGCHGDTEQRWTLHCDDDKWRGIYHNCTDGKYTRIEMLHIPWNMGI